MLRDVLAEAALGALQGLTEFLPVSSSGHLALGAHLFGMGEGTLAFIVLVHVATLLATLAVLVPEARIERAGGLAGLLERLWQERNAVLGLAVATLVTIAVALPLRHWAEAATLQPLWVAGGFLISGIAVLSVRFVRARAALPQEAPKVWAYGVIGLVQGIAVWPGISRSGSTIAAALWLGFNPTQAFRFSFWLSVPAIAGAALLTVLSEVREKGAAAAAAELGVSTLIAFVSAALVGYLALRLVRRSLLNAWFHRLAYYLFPLAALTAWLSL